MSATTLPDEFILPNYRSGSVANIPATVSALFGVPFEGLPEVEPSLWEPLRGDVRRVVVILLDALGLNLFDQYQDAFEWYVSRAATVGRITSVFPSTTVAALSSLWTGVGPIQHGLVGLRLFFPEFAVLGQMLRLSPNFAKFPDSLLEAGLDPKTFLLAPGVAEQFASVGIESHAFKPLNIVDSALSTMHGRGVSKQHGCITSAEMFHRLADLLNEDPKGGLYTVAYWPTIDTLSHIHGVNSPIVASELRSLLSQIRHILFGQLRREAREGTIFIITGDHGQIDTPVKEAVNLADHPKLRDMLLMRTAGEARTPYLYVRQNRTDDVMTYLRTELADRLVTWKTGDALREGLFGPGTASSLVVDRLGDIIVTMRRGSLLLNPDEVAKTPRIKSRHGGMTKDEMLVPWLALRLD